MASTQKLLAAFADLPWQPPTLRTQRLLLRPFRPEDAADHLAYASDPEVAKDIGWPPIHDLAGAQSWLVDWAAKRYRDGVPDPFAIERLSEPGRVVGSVGAFWVSRQHQHMALAYVLHREVWGQGLALEASRALVDHLFQAHPVWRVGASCTVENLASQRVMAKLGLRHEGVARGAWWLKGRFRDLHTCAILRPEWPGAGPMPVVTGP